MKLIAGLEDEFCNYSIILSYYFYYQDMIKHSLAYSDKNFLTNTLLSP